jgi:hypothetical protein
MLKAYLTSCNEGTKKSPGKILTLQNKTEAKTTLLTTTQIQLKQKIVFTSLYTSFMSNRQSLQVISVNITGDRFRKGEDIRHIVSVGECR